MPNIKKIATDIKFDALIWNTKHRLTGEILDMIGLQLKAVSTVSSGLDHLDRAELNTRGILVGRTTEMHNTVAELVIGLFVAASRRFKEGNELVNRGEWKFGVNMMFGHNIAESTVGIVGLGGIGQAVVRRLQGFDITRFLYAGRSDKPEAKALGVKRVAIDVLLKESDFIVLCCPLTPETKHLINESSLRTMKKNSVLVNVARGGIVDHEALYHALKEQQIFAAALDVTNPEPITKDHPLTTLPSCLILPHIGSATYGTRKAMGITAAKNILLALEGKPMINPVL